MNTALIDIIIPNRNKARFLPATLASLVAQTETRWHAVVIDGDSTDGSFEILQAAAAKDARITVRSARPPSTTGLSFYRAWNQGLLQVRAPYFAILTSDDLWEPTWLARAIAALEAEPNAIAASARAIMIDTEGKIGAPTPACRQLEKSFALRGDGFHTLPSNDCCLRALTLGPLFSTIHALVFRRAVLEEGGLFAEDVGVTADVEYYLHTCLLGDVVYDLSSRAFFRVYPEQASSLAGGPSVTRQWKKVVLRNRRLVAERLGIPLAGLTAATDEILARHRFMMTKPDRATFRRSKLTAAWHSIKASAQSPLLFLEYIRCRLDFDRFFSTRVNELTSKLSRGLSCVPVK